MGAGTIFSPNILTQPTDSQAIIRSSPRHIQTPIRSQSPSFPENNPTKNINTALLSSPHTISPPRPIKNLFTSKPYASYDFESTTPCVEGNVHGFGLNSTPEPAPQNIFYQLNTSFFAFLNAVIDLDYTLEMDGIVNMNRSLSLSPAKETKRKFEILQKHDSKVQFSIRVLFTGISVHPNPIVGPEFLYRTFFCFLRLFKT